jgi:hypothetical protein
MSSQFLKIFLGLAGVAVVSAGCGASFTSECKSAINSAIEARENAVILSGFSQGPCDGQVSREEKGEALAAACDFLDEQVRDIRVRCIDNYSDALDKVLLAERQY